MKFKVIENKGGKLRFVVEGVKPGFVNAIRRAAMFYVPVLAIEDVFFTKNSGAMYDEQLAHRLGLLPLKTDLKSYTKKDECSCKGKGCGKCQASYTLKIKGPCTVYARDLNAKDDDAKPVFPEMPVTILLEKQEIELQATAQLGTGVEHVKWQPCHAFYSEKDERFEFTIESFGQLAPEAILNKAAELAEEQVAGLKVEK